MTIVDPALVIPSAYSMTSGERRTLQFDATARLAAGEVIASAIATCTRVSDGTVVSLGQSPIVNGALVALIVDASASLAAGATYLLRLAVTTSPASNRFDMDLQLTVTP